MQRIPVKSAVVGMILAKPAVRTDGMILMGADAVLTAPMLERVKQANIASIVVKGRPLPELCNGIDLVQVRDNLPYLFRKYQTNPLMLTMQKMLTQYLEQEILAEEESRIAETNSQPDTNEA